MRIIVITMVVLITTMIVAAAQWDRYRAKVLEVYDGDTVTLEVELGLDIRSTQKCRLLGIDTPELRGEEREEGLRVRDTLRAWILDQDITIQTDRDKRGKYGRLLVTIFKDTVNINQKLLRDGYAREY